MVRDDILAMLFSHQDTFLSGQEISRQLHITRAAVWKAVQSLRDDGYEIKSLQNKGYCLSSAPDIIRPGELKAKLSATRIGQEILCFDEIDSTNNEAKRLAIHGAKDGTVLCAELQTAGRGRAGRGFQSPKHLGLYLSVLLRPDQSPEAVADFTAWTAVAVCNGIEACCGIRPQIKWTNDLILNGKKLCGILTELSLDAETRQLEYLIVGIGVNVNHQLNHFQDDVRDIATSLSLALGTPVRRADLAASILSALDAMLCSFPHEKAAYLAQYRNDCVTVGKEIQIITPATRETATALDIDDQFRLVVQLADGTRKALSAGEVSVRGMYGYV